MQGQANAVPPHEKAAPVLHRYPYLVYAPQQHGDFIATEDRGLHVGLLAKAVAEGATQEQVAATYETTVNHVRDAVRYCEDHPDA